MLSANPEVDAIREEATMYREPERLRKPRRLREQVKAIAKCRDWEEYHNGGAGEPPEPYSPEAQREIAMLEISYVANRCFISEYEIFAKAYFSWFGSLANTEMLEFEFISCVKREQDLPFYVRQFVRRIASFAA